MWKIAQPSPSSTAKKAPTRPAPAIIHRSRKMISPAYMLPKSRSECDRGLEMYSTRLNRRLKQTKSGDIHRGLTPNGVQDSPSIQQHGRHQRIHVQGPERALAHRVLQESEVMADVGARRQFMLGGHCGKLFLNPTFREPVLPW